MKGLSIQAFGQNDVISLWQSRRITPFWAIFIGSTCIDFNSEDDFEDAEYKLMTFFEGMKDKFTDQTLSLKMYSKGLDEYSSKDKAQKTFFFTISERESYQNNKVSGIGANDSLILSKLNSIESRINAIENVESGEEEEEEETESEKLLSGVNTLLDNPVIANIIGLITNKLFMPNETQTITKLAGVPDDKTAVYQYIEILLQKGVTIEHLQKLSQMPSAKIKGLLMML
jgi:hypothetical protein